MSDQKEIDDASDHDFPVCAILERRPASSAWADHVWEAVGITVGRGGDERRARLVREQDGTASFLVGGLAVSLHRDECESYYYNIVSQTPRAYIVARRDDDGADDMPHPFLVSLSFDEAHAYLEADDDIFAVDIPAELYRWAEAFVLANYFPEKKRKRKLRNWSEESTAGSRR